MVQLSTVSALAYTNHDKEPLNATSIAKFTDTNPVVQANHPFSPSSGRVYYEITILRDAEDW
jgi:hypothetical protein